MRKTQVYINNIPTMVEDNLLTDGVKYYKEDMTPDIGAIQAEAKTSRISEIDASLIGIDIKKIRPLSELLINSTPEAVAILNELNADAKLLRDERKLLDEGTQ